ncbi:MAG: hypothetical protein ACI8O8_001762 [Oleiphilaceae bacterium]|jgi:hypothetical protein
MKNNNIKISARFSHIKKVSVLQLLEMHKLFIQYYNNADLQTFVTDMGKKTGVFILEDKAQNRIVGFSTWTEMEVIQGEQKSIGIFSGDTVVERAYWGNRELQKIFAKKLFTTKLKYPKTPVFWLLISKGYKTYLLLTNNFHQYYPCHQSHNPKLEAIVDEYCEHLYPHAYDRKNRLLNFGNAYQHLKEDVACITEEMKNMDKNIRYFEKLNPSWKQGTELPCAGEVTISMLLNFMKRKIIPFHREKRKSSEMVVS